MKKIFRQKYQYNPDKPVFTSNNVKTYNCMNTQTGNKRLIIIEHLVPPPFVQPSPSILQPIQIPTTAQPFSVYPITFCVSQVTRMNEPDAMYVIKCLAQCKLKKPLYYVLSDQGICCSDVEGVLPQKSPSLDKIAIDLLGIQQNLQPKQNCSISRQGLDITKAIRNGQNVAGRFLQYGWKDPKSSKDVITDEQFLIFKGRRKQEGIFDSQYGLAWHNKQHGMCRFKYISLAKNGFQQHFYKQFTDLINYAQGQNPLPFLKNLKLFKDTKGIKIFTQLANQGSLSQYINNKSQMGQILTQKNGINMLNTFVESMKKFSSQFKNQGLGTLHIRSFYVHNNRLCIGDPLLITDLVQQKIRTSKKTLDYFAPQLKQTIIDQNSYKNLSKQKMDVWSFGFILHKILTKQLPVFDSSKKPNLNKSKLSVAMSQLITKCLDQYPISRPTWKDINLKDIQKKAIMIEQVKQDQSQREQIKLGAKNQKRSEKPKSPQKKQRVVEQLEEQQEKAKQRQSQQANLKYKQQEQIDQKMPIPQQVTSKVRKVKLVCKTIIIMAIYIFVFFRVFIWSSAQIIQVRSYYSTTSLNLVDNRGNKISSTSIITSNPMYFMANSVSFDEVQNTYQCIDQNFNPVYDPTYSLLNYIQSGGFLALLITGWATMAIICVTKAISMWKGGISNRPDKSKQIRHWITYAFHELTIAALLFAHFYIYEFFYFAGATPCLSIKNFQGIQAFFDSSLYLFLSNTQAYFRQVFSTLGILSIVLLLSTCFYAWGPKIDQKYIGSIPSLLLRVVPFILFLLICRIGVFLLYSPTAINDKTELIPTIISNSFQGFIGMIPEVFILCCVTIEVLIQLLMYWCEKKTSQSDRLARFFNIRKKKTTLGGDISRIQKSAKSIQKSNLDNSKMKLDTSSNQIY